MTKEEAIQEMKQGKKVSHRYFDDNEWMTIDEDGMYLLEDGARCTPLEFWLYRPGDYWKDGYFLFEEN